MVSQLNSKRLFMVRHRYYPSAREKPRFLPLTIYKIRAGFKIDMSEGRNDYQSNGWDGSQIAWGREGSGGEP